MTDTARDALTAAIARLQAAREALRMSVNDATLAEWHAALADCRLAHEGIEAAAKARAARART